MLTWHNVLSTPTPDLSACSGLRRLDYSAGTYGALIQLLRSTGATLEHLYVAIQFVNQQDSVNVVDLLYDRCRQVKSLLFEFDFQVVEHVGEPRYVSLLCSYGDQLLGVRIHYLSLDSHRSVVESCKALGFDYASLYNDNPLDAKHTEIIGSRINSLNIFDTPCYQDEWSTALGRCTKLQLLSTNNVEVLWLLPSLSQLRELMLNTSSLTPQDISRIVSKTSKLTVVHFDSLTLIENGTIFKPLVESNKFLRSAIIRGSIERAVRSLERRRSTCVLRVLTQLCDTFSNCKLLTVDLRVSEKLDITDRDVQNVCAVLPCRGVQIAIHVGRDASYSREAN